MFVDTYIHAEHRKIFIQNENEWFEGNIKDIKLGMRFKLFSFNESPITYNREGIFIAISDSFMLEPGVYGVKITLDGSEYTDLVLE